MGAQEYDEWLTARAAKSARDWARDLRAVPNLAVGSDALAELLDNLAAIAEREVAA
jgi:hypothetical protein